MAIYLKEMVMLLMHIMTEIIIITTEISHIQIWDIITKGAMGA